MRRSPGKGTKKVALTLLPDVGTAVHFARELTLREPGVDRALLGTCGWRVTPSFTPKRGYLGQQLFSVPIVGGTPVVALDGGAMPRDTTPVAIDQQGGHTRFWVTSGGGVQADDTSILRADQSRTVCNVTTLGLQCSPGLEFGTPGSVVMGGGISVTANTSHLPFLPGPACWLESTGEAFCGLHAQLPTRINKTMTLFGGRPALALATQFYTNEICAVLADGAVECVRVAIDTGTTVSGPSAPAGSAMIGCP